jgi:hypothetical protein
VTDPTYNYRRFTPEEYEFAEFTGLSAGDRFVDADLHRLDGGTARLSDFLDKPLVLETGSMTCPMYAQSAPPMQDMVTRFPDLNFVVLYVREAHPGERTPQHASQTATVDTAIRSRARHQRGARDAGRHPRRGGAQGLWRDAELDLRDRYGWHGPVSQHLEQHRQDR